MADELPLLLDGDDGAFMSRVAHVMSPPKPKPDPKPDAAEAKDAPEKAPSPATGEADGL